MSSPSSLSGPPEPEQAPPREAQRPNPAAGLPPSYPPTGYPPATGSYGGYPAPHPYPAYYPPGSFWPPPPIQKPTGWFIVSWLFFWPLAVYSLVSAWQNIDPAYYHGDLAGAQLQCRRVRKFGIISLCVGIGWTVLIIILWAVVFAVAIHNCNSNPYGC